MRIVLGIAGTALALWGAWLLLPQITIELMIWLGGGVLVHDLVIAPLVGASGFVVRRTSVGVGLVLSATLVLLAVPLLWRPFGGPANPGLHDRDYPSGLAVVLGLVWAVVALHELVRSWRERRVRRNAISLGDAADHADRAD